MTAALAIILGLVLLWLLYGPLPTLYVKGRQRRELARLAGPALLLTFDDGPDPNYTPAFLDVLGRNQAKALFFLVGSQAGRYPELAARIREEGHTLGWHGPRHQNMWFTGYFATKKALQAGVMLAPGGQTPRYYRPPYGNVNVFTLALAQKYGLRLLLWTVMIRDWRLTQPLTLLERLEQGCQKGGVLLLHDCGADSSAQPGAPANTLKALEMFLPQMRAQGYPFLDPKDLP